PPAPAPAHQVRLRPHPRRTSYPLPTQHDPLKYLAPEDLVARPHVRQVQIREDVRQVREDRIGEGVSVQEDAMRPPEKPRPVDDVGEIALDRIDEPEVLLRIVLEVGVLNDDDASAR